MNQLGRNFGHDFSDKKYIFEICIFGSNLQFNPKSWYVKIAGFDVFPWTATSRSPLSVVTLRTSVGAPLSEPLDPGVMCIDLSSTSSIGSPGIVLQWINKIRNFNINLIVLKLIWTKIFKNSLYSLNSVSIESNYSQITKSIQFILFIWRPICMF